MSGCGLSLRRRSGWYTALSWVAGGVEGVACFGHDLYRAEEVEGYRLVSQFCEREIERVFAGVSRCGARV